MLDWRLGTFENLEWPNLRRNLDDGTSTTTSSHRSRRERTRGSQNRRSLPKSPREPPRTVCLRGVDYGILSGKQHRRSRRGAAQVGTTLKNGTVFRVIEFAPGVAPRIHRTDSIDYAVVMSGEIDMGSARLCRPPESGRRARAARHDPQLGQSRYRSMRDRFHPYRREASRGRRKGLECGGLDRWQEEFNSKENYANSHPSGY